MNIQYMTKGARTIAFAELSKIYKVGIRKELLPFPNLDIKRQHNKVTISDYTDRYSDSNMHAYSIEITKEEINICHCLLGDIPENIEEIESAILRDYAEVIADIQKNSKFLESEKDLLIIGNGYDFTNLGYII